MDDLLKFLPVLDVNEGDSTPLCHQAPGSQAGNILIKDRTGGKEETFEDQPIIGKTDLPEQDQRHAGEGESEDQGEETIGKKPVGCHSHEEE